MDNPDKIFREPWGSQIQQGRSAQEETIRKTEAAWARAQDALPKAQEALEEIRTAAKEISRIKETMEDAKEDIVRIEGLTEEVEKEIRIKREALDILDNIVDSIKISKDEMQALEEPIFTTAQEIAKIEEALHKVDKCLGIKDERILSIRLVQERQKVFQGVSTRFEKKTREFILKVCLRNKKTPTEVHDFMGRYTEIINYLVRKGVFEECLRAYTATISKLHRACILNKVEDIAKPFKKSKNILEFNGKIEPAIILLIQLMYSLVATEEYFLSEIFTMNGSGANTNILRDIFIPAEQELLALPGILYNYGYEVGVINLLASKFEWPATPSNTPSEKTAAHKISGLISQIKKKVHELKETYLKNMKKIISKEYSKEGAIELDRTFYNTVDVSVVPSVNTEVLKLNLTYSSKVSAQAERVYQVVKRASILGSIQAHCLENKQLYESNVNSLLDEEIEKTTSNLLYLAENKVFEKEKLSSIVKRTKEIMDLLNNVEDPLGNRLQVAFKDMVLSKANFHQRNDIAAVLTANKKDN
ncbi:hypothetical protein NEPAR06_1159 [Nematocida parisii]|nr:uncharacterized protein NEPG_00689 [Nematocida parisii ERTm1]EIJ94024.1 hypothetical protein NEPG_00689 [Nematocida parisii ERTm1]KAI5144692.1 hypothetical protein NEPAR07_1229 [Nematocida parisii]KAI5154484.1 hypothetical protein NEPAR06_1159 [Nematocida parisii]KAI5157488.1 hypothetical protein NEPAR05_1321 [Nematocida parisii]|eukprot:XP_013058520.1 hypothetical protein NEPG_00689 [Nematocida parisii ERTm1]